MVEHRSVSWHTMPERQWAQSMVARLERARWSCTQGSRYRKSLSRPRTWSLQEQLFRSVCVRQEHWFVRDANTLSSAVNVLQNGLPHATSAAPSSPSLVEIPKSASFTIPSLVIRILPLQVDHPIHAQVVIRTIWYRESASTDGLEYHLISRWMTPLVWR